jgi:hypothetical protein
MMMKLVEDGEWTALSDGTISPNSSNSHGMVRQHPRADETPPICGEPDKHILI